MNRVKTCRPTPQTCHVAPPLRLGGKSATVDGPLFKVRDCRATELRARFTPARRFSAPLERSETHHRATAAQASKIDSPSPHKMSTPVGMVKPEDVVDVSDLDGLSGEEVRERRPSCAWLQPRGCCHPCSPRREAKPLLGCAAGTARWANH
eukprot:7180381-Prymnesium_polylepis.1